MNSLKLRLDTPRNKRILDKGEKAFERALATLELLFILEEEEQTIAEALMLKASIFIRLGKIDDAKLTLAYLLERFRPPHILHAGPASANRDADQLLRPALTRFQVRLARACPNGLRVFSGRSKNSNEAGCSLEIYENYTVRSITFVSNQKHSVKN